MTDGRRAEAFVSIFGREPGPWRFARGRAGTARWHGLARLVLPEESDDCRVPAKCGHGAVYAWVEFSDVPPPLNPMNLRCATCSRLGAFAPPRLPGNEWLSVPLPAERVEDLNPSGDDAPEDDEDESADVQTWSD
jgi:hypothetical protein